MEIKITVELSAETLEAVRQLQAIKETPEPSDDLKKVGPYF